MWPFSSRAACRTAPARRPAPYRPRLDGLEQRCLLDAGYLDPTFGAGGAGLLRQGAGTVLIQPNGQILAFNGNSITRYNTDGTPDTSFGSGGTAQALFGVGGEALLPNGQILISGLVSLGSTTGNHPVGFGLARLNSDGSLDTSFGSQGEVTTSFSPALQSQNASMAGLVVQPDGKIVVAGGNGGNVYIKQNLTQIGAFDLARYNANGSLDTTFGNQGTVVTSLSQYFQVKAEALLLQPNGDLIAIGDTGVFNRPQNAWLLARYNPNGSLDASFGSQGIVTTPFPSGTNLSGAVLYPNTGTANDGRIVVVGWNSSASGPALARYNPNGSLDTSFGAGGFVPLGVNASGVAFDASGRLVVSGTTGANSSSQMALERLTDATPDPTFGSGGVVTAGLPGDQGGGLALYPSTGTDTADAGKIVVAGSHVARFLPAAPQPGPNFIVTGSSSTTAGVSFTVTVTATDAAGNTLTGYTGTVNFGSFDAQAVLPASYTFTAADQGVHTFTVTLKTAGSQALFVADAAAPGTNGRLVGIQVNPGPVARFLWNSMPSTSVKANTAFNLYLPLALDAYGNQTTCSDTVGFTSSDPKAILPGNQTFQSGGAWAGSVTFRTRDTQTITMTDLNNPALSVTLTFTVS
jgi:uncharacterized delta-60 repeat protein